MKKYDVFISYAIEDKRAVAAEIAQGLRRAGLSVYFVGDELGSGDSVSETVYEGLDNSSYFVLVLSKSYVRRWTTVEWSNVLRRDQKKKGGVIFPVWHGVAHEDVKQLFSELTDHYAKSTAEGVDVVVHDLVVELKKRIRQDLIRKWIIAIGLLLVLALVVITVKTAVSYTGEASTMPSTEDAEAIVKAHIDSYQKKLSLTLLEECSQHNATLISLDTVRRIYNHYSSINEGSRNDYYFSTAYENVTGRDNIEDRGIVLVTCPLNGYGVSASCIWYLERRVTDSASFHHVVFADTAAMHFQIDTMYYDVHTHDVHVWVSYDRYLRCVYYKLNYSTDDSKLRQHVRLVGYKPEEEYILNNQSGRWELQCVK